MKSLRRASICLLTIILPLLGAIAQSPSAAISGFVDDPAKAVVPGAKITAINTDTGLRGSTESNSDGAYSISGLIPGPYRVEVEKPGFKTILDAGLVLHVQDSVQLNFHMSLSKCNRTLLPIGSWFGQ